MRWGREKGEEGKEGEEWGEEWQEERTCSVPRLLKLTGDGAKQETVMIP